MKRTLEVCTVSTAGVIAAANGGATRVELCSALEVGGVTPSPGLIKESRLAAPDMVIHVLIRPRGGDFVYDDYEINAMIRDIKMACDNDADGVVIGALTPDGEIDTEACARMVAAVPEGKNITFHRAFDVCNDPFKALEQIIELGCNRILTSGQAPDMLQGAPVLAQLNKQAAGRLTILPGGGLSPAIAAQVLNITGCNELHGSLREPDMPYTASSRLVNLTIQEMNQL